MSSVRILEVIFAVIAAVIAFVSSQSYIVYDEQLLRWQDGNAFCAFSYGTSLASIHDVTEDNESGLECTASTQGNGCWIGATLLGPGDWATNDGIWKWSDGTAFNYGNGTRNPPNSEFCLAIDKATKGWNNSDCDELKPILCNSPSNSSSIVMDENINNARHPTNHSIGKMNILDDVSVEFDFMVSSLPTRAYRNILHIGSNHNLYPRLPSIYVANDTGMPSLSVFFSVIDNENTFMRHGPISLGRWYPFSFHITQSNTVVSMDGNIIETRSNQSSHAILRNEDITDIFILSDWRAPELISMDGLVRNMKITSDNAYRTPFNYLCDYDNRFTVLSGSWAIDKAKCWLSETSYEGGNVVWLGDKDPRSIEWTDYTIEFVVNIHNVSEPTAQAGLLLRALSVSKNNNQGQQYWVDIKKTTNAMRFRQANQGNLTAGTTYTKDIHWEFNQDYTIRVEVVGSRLSVYLNHKYKFDEISSAYNHGSIGFRTHKCNATFKRLRIIFPNTNSRISLNPTASPTQPPTVPTNTPTLNPSTPTLYPTKTTLDPTMGPTMIPTNVPTMKPTALPTNVPTSLPTLNPTIIPTNVPTNIPTLNPSIPTLNPTKTSNFPTMLSTMRPTNVPTLTSINPTVTPTILQTRNPFIESTSVVNNSDMNQMIPWIVAGVVAICVVLVIILFGKHRMKGTNPEQYIIPVNSNGGGVSQMVVPTDSKSAHVLTEDVIHVNVQSKPVMCAVVPINKVDRDITELKQWLTCDVKLPQYVPNFTDNGYETMQFVCDISSVDELIDIGITLRGHQTRILAELKKFKTWKQEKQDRIAKEKQEQQPGHKLQRSLLNELEADDESDQLVAPLTVEGSPQQHYNDGDIQGSVRLDPLSLDGDQTPSKIKYVFDNNNDEEVFAPNEIVSTK
eukprot:153178_1